MAYRVVPDRQGLINIGKLKENLVTEVELPAPGFAGGSYVVLLRRPKEDTAYPVSSRHEGNALIWTVQTADTAIPGTGKLECRWYGDNGEVAKSQTYMVRITDGLPDPTEAPEAWEGFMGQVARNAQAAQTAAGEAKANADGAAASAGIAQDAAAEAEKQAGAAGDAANAAASAASAASRAQAGAETAGQDARAAAEAAETARSGAEAAKLAAAKSATAAAGSAEAAAQAAQKGENLYNQVKDDLATGKLKGDKGEKGDPGKDAPQIDDSAVTDSNPWSSRHIVETLCPPIAETGNPVTCYPVAGYPLGVVASWEPTQAGEGEPSPENIRPISGRDSVGVERCGENLLDIDLTNQMVGNTTAAEDGGWITINGTSSGGNLFLRIGFVLRPGKYTAKLFGGTFIDNNNALIWIYGGTISRALTSKTNTVTLSVNETTTVNVYLHLNKAVTFSAEKFAVALVPGTTAPTTYVPYRGDARNLQLPRTVYGGNVDAVTEEGVEGWKSLTLDGNETWNTWGVNANNATVTGFYTYDISDYDIQSPAVVCSNLPSVIDVWGGKQPGVWFATSGSTCYFIYSVPSVMLDDISDNAHAIASLKSYLAAQAAAGTPVQIAYKLAEPVAFQATGNGPLLPIPGETNTIMTDADSVTVTGRADLAHAIAALQAQLAVATQQLVETQAAVVDTTAMAVDYIYQQDLEDIGLEEVDDSDNQTDTEPVDVPGV